MGASCWNWDGDPTELRGWNISGVKCTLNSQDFTVTFSRGHIPGSQIFVLRAVSEHHPCLGLEQVGLKGTGCTVREMGEVWELSNPRRDLRS